jgi:hypothetical protein
MVYVGGYADQSDGFRRVTELTRTSINQAITSSIIACLAILRLRLRVISHAGGRYKCSCKPMPNLRRPCTAKRFLRSLVYHGDKLGHSISSSATRAAVANQVACTFQDDARALQLARYHG